MNRQKKWYSKPENKIKQAAYQEKWRQDNPVQWLLTKAKSRARRKGLDIDIELSDIIIPDECPYFKLPFTVSGDYVPTIDRIDSSKGYVKGNIRVISLLANLMKSTATEEQLIMFANGILLEHR